MSECDRKTIFGRPACRFEARYDQGAIDAENFYASDLITIETHDRVDALAAWRKQTYVRDVCVKCGKTIERATNGA